MLTAKPYGISQDTGSTEGLLSSYFGHPLLRQHEWIR